MAKPQSILSALFYGANVIFSEKQCLRIYHNQGFLVNLSVSLIRESVTKIYLIK